MTCKTKLIEVALPLGNINRDPPKAKSILHGHTSEIGIDWYNRTTVWFNRTL